VPFQHPHHHQQHQQLIHASGPPHAPGPPRTKSKAYATGIAAGAEDAKYQTKYKELKRKVKEIESVRLCLGLERPFTHIDVQDNDKLQFKILQAKRSIQRMKLEQAYVFHF
jgi:hypothetical protein